MICILHVFGSPRAAWARIILQSTDTEFRYDFKSSQVFRLRKKEKEMYFKNLKKRKKKRKHLFGGLHLRTLTLHPFPSTFFVSFARKFTRQEHAPYDTHATHCQFCSWKRLLESVVTYSLQRSAILYAHSTYPSSILSLSCTLYSCLFHSRSLLSFYQIYLYTYLFLCCTFFRQYSNAFTLCTSFLAGPWRRRAGCWPD